MAIDGKTIIKAGISALFYKKRERRITLEGVFFVIAAFVIGFASFNTGDNTLYLVMSLMLSFLVFSGILSTQNLKRIKVHRKISPHVIAKQDTEIALVLKNKKRRFASYSMEVEDYLSNEECFGAGFTMKVPGDVSGSIVYMNRFARRGIYHLSKIRITSRFPFGFFERSVIYNEKSEVVVYPETIDITSIIGQDKFEFGEVDSRKKGEGINLSTLREYESGDNARNIHWKASAKLDKLVIKEFEKDEKKKISIILENIADDSNSINDAANFEKAVVYAASFAKYFIDKDYQVELQTYSGYIPFGNGPGHLIRIFRSLAIINQIPIETFKNKPSSFSNIDKTSRKVLIKNDSTVKM